MEGQTEEAARSEGRAWRIEPVGENFKVVFNHNGNAYELGLFSTREEGTRVADVLTIKEAVDKGQDLNTLRLEYPLDRYGVDNNTAHEIRSVSFNQVVRDLQCCCVEQLVPDGTVPGWTTELPSTHYRSIGEQEFHDRVSQGTALTAPMQQLASHGAHGEEEGGAGTAGDQQVQQQRQPEMTAPLSAKGLPQLPPRPLSRSSGPAVSAPRAASHGQAEGPASAATNAFQAAGKANADAAAAAAAAAMPAPPPRLPLSQRTSGGMSSPRAAQQAGQGMPALQQQQAQHGALAATAAAAGLQQAAQTVAVQEHQQQEEAEVQAAGALPAGKDSGAPGGLVLRLPPTLQPIRPQFRGITQAGRKWRCQTHISGRNVGLVAGTTQMEAALMYDLLMIWKHYSEGRDPSKGDYNFSFHDIAQDESLLNILRDCITSDTVTSLLTGLVSTGAVARVFGLEPLGHKISKVEASAARAAQAPAAGSGKKLHWRTKQRLEREQAQQQQQQMEQQQGAEAAAGAEGDEQGEGHEAGGYQQAAYAHHYEAGGDAGPGGQGEEGLAEEDEAFEGEEEEEEEYELEGRPRKRKQKKLHWRTVQRLERERQEAAAAAAAAAGGGSGLVMSDGGAGSSGKKLHWRTVQKMEREAAAARTVPNGAAAEQHAATGALGSGEHLASGTAPSREQQQQQYQPSPASPSSAALVAGGVGVVEEGAAPVSGRAVLSYRFNSHPFHGLSVTTQKDPETGDTLLHAQFSIYFDSGGRLTWQSSPDKKIVHSCPCRTPAEAAVAWDLGHIWKTIQIGDDPAVLSPREGYKASRRCNFSRARYLNDPHLMQRIRACRDYRMLQELWRELNKSGKLRQLAIMSPGPAALAQQQQQGAAAAGAYQAGPSGEGAAGAGAKRPAPPPEEGPGAGMAPPPKQHKAGPAGPSGGRQLQQQVEARQDGGMAAQAAAAIPVPPGAGRALYEPREEVRIQAFEHTYYTLKRMLEGLGAALSLAERTRFMAYYLRMRDGWRVIHDEIKGLLEAGFQSEAVRFVRESLGIQEQQRQ